MTWREYYWLTKWLETCQNRVNSSSQNEAGYRGALLDRMCCLILKNQSTFRPTPLLSECDFLLYCWSFMLIGPLRGCIYHGLSPLHLFARPRSAVNKSWHRTIGKMTTYSENTYMPGLCYTLSCVSSLQPVGYSSSLHVRKCSQNS